MRTTFLPFSPPLIGDEEIAEVMDTLRSDWITTGPKVRRFEQEFAAFIGAPAALAVSSATDAMLVGLAALGVGPGDEVITTPMTFCSTVHVIEHLGARPVLVDVMPDTLNIDPEQVARAITPRTRGIMPVHLYGHPCEMDALHDLADRHNLFILEDAAHSLPARYKGRMIGVPRDQGAGGQGAADGVQLLRDQEPDHGRRRHVDRRAGTDRAGAHLEPARHEPRRVQALQRRRARGTTKSSCPASSAT